jgi:hypothetical protein
MAKKKTKGKSPVNRKLQEIIGRALTDEKFAKALVRSPQSALAEYELDKSTLALVERGIKLRGELDQVASELQEGFGIEVQSI